MTTNHPEKLDEALIRPGRVDHQVAFGNATQMQIKELFERMYTHDLPRTKIVLSSPSAAPIPAPASVAPPTTKSTPPAPLSDTHLLGAPVTANGYANVGMKEKKEEEVISEEEISKIAEQFAHQVPNDMLSPAEIQGFLLKRKKDPRKAVVDVKAWVEGMVEQKKKGTKLAAVQ